MSNDVFDLDVRVTAGQSDPAAELWPTGTCLTCTAKCPSNKPNCTILVCPTTNPWNC